MAQNTFSDTVLLQDNVALTFGTDSDASITYDESGDDRVELTGADWYWTTSGTMLSLGGPNIFKGTSATQMQFQQNSATTSLIDFDAAPQDGTSAANVRFGRSTNTTGAVRYRFYRGNGADQRAVEMLGGSSGTLTVYNSSNTATITLDGANGDIDLDNDLTFADAGNVIVGTTTGTKIGTATTQKIGLWNATPVVQPSTTGTTTGFTAGSGTSANDDSTFTGNTGTAAYTVGDIVLALKQVGILAAS